MYPKHHTQIHVIRGTKVWESGKGGNPRFSINKVGTGISIGELVELLRGVEAEECKGWVLTEVRELGDGEWEKVRLRVVFAVGDIEGDERLTFGSTGCRGRVWD